ncbi:MAG TPA: YbfB/YjiJ family MFS transporter [Caldimonas sp.]|nr:YbfB/YjiJ family MFS transporter [Caldimonas sp.]HEX2542925.1 YbfB/YjiJ family MFS transporter [Caldimonas sp.]
MGIGRFAFTPVLPLMLGEGLLDLAQAGWLAAANYAGYLAGALSASRLPLRAGALAALALIATAASTAAMALPSPALWLPLRFVAGAASAWVFVATSVWCLGALARRGATRASGWVYAGVGFGIATAGLHCLFAAAAGVASQPLWLQLGGLALLLSLPVFWAIARLGWSEDRAGPPGPAEAAPADARSTRGLVVCYGVMGYGYILPATFLPVLARGVVDDPRLFGLAWPLFGATAALSTLVAARLLHGPTRLRAWAACQLLMGIGVLLPALRTSAWTIAASALLVGGTFMTITLAGVQEMRARAASAGQAASLVGRITAAFALGQIAGPVVSSFLLQLGPEGLALALASGACALFATAAWLWRSGRPRAHSKETFDA